MLQEQWSSGSFQDLSQGQFGNAVLGARAIGNCEALEMLVELDYETIILGEFSDGEQKRPEASGASSVS